MVEEQKPLCKCHNYPMTRAVVAKSRQLEIGKSHYWRCTIHIREWNRENRKKLDPIKKYRTHRNIRLKQFGITEEDYQNMVNRQNGLCAICGSEPDTRWKMLAVDHNHKTGEIRGLLCMVCNTMLGRLENRFNKTMEYLNVNYEKQ